MATAPDAPEEVVVQDSVSQIFNVYDFISTINNGLSKPNKFLVNVSLPTVTDEKDRNIILPHPVTRTYKSTVENLSFFCDAAELPGRTLNTTDVKIHGLIYKSPNFNQYSDITLTILCDHNLTQKNFFESWINYISPTPKFNFKYRDSYAGSVDITQYNERGVAIHRVRLIEAYPIALNPMPLSWGEDGVHRLQVTLTYKYWVKTLEKIITYSII